MSSRISISGLTKSFRTPVLKGIDLELGEGEIHGLVGENGAGKSTLMNIICGLVSSDSGQMQLDGLPYQPAKSRDAFDAGISLAAQELSLVDNLSVAENMCLKDLPRSGLLIQRQLLIEKFNELASLLEINDQDPATLVGNLSLGQKQLVELAKALSSECRLLILDEPTAALTESQSQLLHQVIRQQAETGTSVIYISHRLNDVLDIADRVSIMRDGEIVDTSAAKSSDVERIIELMSGEVRSMSAREHAIPGSKLPGIKVNSLTTSKIKQPVSFECSRGEIFGIAGLSGSGQSELLESLFGLGRITSGEILVSENDKWHHILGPKDALALKVGYLPEDRKTAGIFQGQDLSFNMALPGLARHSTKTGIIRQKSLTAAVKKFLEKLDIKCTGPGQLIEQLSGGNQQKVLVSRWLHNDSDILLLNEPTRGVDVNTIQYLHTLFLQLAAQGKTIIMVSSEMAELTGLCDHILVMSNGKPAGVFGRDEWSNDILLGAAFSGFSRRNTGMIH